MTCRSELSRILILGLAVVTLGEVKGDTLFRDAAVRIVAKVADHLEATNSATTIKSPLVRSQHGAKWSVYQELTRALGSHGKLRIDSSSSWQIVVDATHQKNRHGGIELILKAHVFITAALSTLELE